MKCRFCKKYLNNKILDLGVTAPSNFYLNNLNKLKYEKKFPLKIFFCKNCYLVQTKDYHDPNQLFTNTYAYYSSISNFFLKHAETYVRKIIRKLNINKKKFVVELASNDGYLLKNFLKFNIPILGIEPTKSTFLQSKKKNIPTLNEFFSYGLSKKIIKSYGKADLIIANNVYAHVKNINNFTRGIKNLLKPKGIVNIEFPHLLNLVTDDLFDTIYHEHYSYLSLSTVKKIFSFHKLKIFDVEKINTHGGSLRLYGCHENLNKKISFRVMKILKDEKKNKLLSLVGYKKLQQNSKKIKKQLINFLVDKKNKKKIVVGYGAAAKGNTLLNYCKIDNKLLKYVYDAAPSKQNKYLPGSHILIKNPDEINKDRPDYIFILPWNIKEEIIRQLGYLKRRGVIFFTVKNGIKIL